MKFVLSRLFSQFSITVAFLFFVVFICWFVFQHYFRIYRNYPPGPIPWPLLGNVLQIDSKHPYISYKDWCKEKYGKLMLVKLGFNRALVINDPVRAREIFNDFTFSGRPQCYFVTVLSGGCNGILVSEGSVWEAQRRFTLRHLRDFGFGKNTMECLIMNNAQEFIETLKKDQGQPLTDLQNRLSLAVLNSLWTIVSGRKYELDDPKLKNILNSLQEGQKAITKHPILIVAPWIRHVIPGLSGYKKFQEVVDRMVGYFQETIEEHKQEYGEDSSDEPRDFIESYLREMRRTKDPNSSFYGEEGEKNLRAVVGDLFQGGSETTGITLTWAILFLMAHPDIQKKLQEEIDTVIGHTRLPTLYDRLRMPYTEAVIIETARMASVIPLGVFHSVLADTYFHDYFIPKGTWIWVNQYAIHMDSHIWGDPENFNPERFLSTDGKFALRSHESFMPFSVGKRECPGKSLANDTLFLFLTSIFQRFTAVPAPGTRIPDILDSDDGFFRAPKKFCAVLKSRATALNNPITFVISD